jgi:glyoxalase family protein
MVTEIKGLHHVTSMAGDAARSNTFFTQTLGLPRVRKTVNFASPKIYHLYFCETVGTAGSVMTYLPFGQMPRGRRGTGEVGTTEFTIPKSALPFWKDRLAAKGLIGLSEGGFAGENRLGFDGPDKDGFALVERDVHGCTPLTGADVPEPAGILGFHGARITLRESAATGELLGFMGCRKDETDGTVTHYRIEGGNAADTIDLEALPDSGTVGQRAGLMHSIAFAVENRAAQQAVRQALMDTGYQVTPVIDGD